MPAEDTVRSVGVIAGALTFAAAAARFVLRSEQTSVTSMRELIGDLHAELERVNDARIADRKQCDAALAESARKIAVLEAEVLALKLHAREDFS